MRIDRDAWLAAVKEAVEAPLPESDALTLKEFAATVGLGRVQAWRRMEQLIDAKKAEATTKAVRRVDGGVIYVPAYRLLKKEGSHDCQPTRGGNARRVRRDRSRAGAGR